MTGRDDVRRAHAIVDRTVHRQLDGARLLLELEGMSQQQRDAQYCAIGVRNALARDIGCGAVDGLVDPARAFTQ